MEDSHQEATEKEVKRILGYLKTDSPILYYEFVIDPKLFSRTVENIFHVSFLIRDGFARMYLDDDELPCIESAENGETVAHKQCFVSISPKTWKELIEACDITDTMIQPLNNTQNE